MLVAATLVTVTTVVLGIFGAVDYDRHHDDEWIRLRRVTRAQATELAVALASPVWSIDRPQIEKILDSQAEVQPIEGIVVKAAGKTHARVRDERRRFVHSDGVFPTTGLLTDERPITFAGEQIGTVRVFTTPGPIRQQLRAVLTRTVIAIVTADLVLILCVYLVLWLIVLRPLGEIERYAGSVSSGARDDDTPVAPGAAAELENLHVSISTMVRLLDERYLELEEQMAQRKAMEKELSRRETMAAMGTLVAGVAHEVRNPLFGMTALLDAYAGTLATPDLQELSAGLREQVVRLTQVTRALLEYGTPVKITLAPSSLHVLAEEAIAGRTRAASSANVTLRNAIDSSLPSTPMDRARMRQVFDNLLDNALQHSPRSTITIAARKVEEDGRSWIDCTVEDDGKGFLPDDLDRVFEPFFTRRERGIGLGMSVVQHIVEEHSGRVTAGNRSEGGAVITVRLPVAEGE